MAARDSINKKQLGNWLTRMELEGVKLHPEGEITLPTGHRFKAGNIVVRDNGPTFWNPGTDDEIEAVGPHTQMLVDLFDDDVTPEWLDNPDTGGRVGTLSAWHDHRSGTTTLSLKGLNIHPPFNSPRLDEAYEGHPPDPPDVTTRRRGETTSGRPIFREGDSHDYLIMQQNDRPHTFDKPTVDSLLAIQKQEMLTRAVEQPMAHSGTRPYSEIPPETIEQWKTQRRTQPFHDDEYEEDRVNQTIPIGHVEFKRQIPGTREHHTTMFRLGHNGPRDVIPASDDIDDMWGDD